ncbi:protein kinase domain-containing protein [Ideonella paludis]|uniref:protein kinase domain-containing protein n=1 Tax=Ideonella paludis TaxID=1233411 RepID=UPI00363FAAB3
MGRHLTPGYASPEQWRGEALGTTSDIYALGIVFYELLVGQHPFHHHLLGRAGAAINLPWDDVRPPSKCVPLPLQFANAVRTPPLCGAPCVATSTLCVSKPWRHRPSIVMPPQKPLTQTSHAGWRASR